MATSKGMRFADGLLYGLGHTVVQRDHSAPYHDRAGRCWSSEPFHPVDAGQRIRLGVDGGRERLPGKTAIGQERRPSQGASRCCPAGR